MRKTPTTLAWHMFLPEMRENMYDYNYNCYKSTLRFPQSNGHSAWRLQAPMIQEAVKEDLLWRKLQTNPDAVEDLVKQTWHDVERCGDEVLITPDLSVSLRPESCGAYRHSRAKSRLPSLSGDEVDMRRIEDALQHPATQGHYLGLLLQYEKGWLPETVYSNTQRLTNMKLTSADRYLFDKKACHKQVLMSAKDRDEAKKFLARFYPVTYGFTCKDVYWYNAENGATIFGVAYFQNGSKEIIKFPVTAWEHANGRSGNVCYDALHPHPPYPLYDLNRLAQLRGVTRYILICPDEFAVEYVKKYHGWMWSTFQICATTYSAIAGTDWGAMGAAKPIILPENTATGYREAFKLSKVLHERGLSPCFVKRTKQDAPRHLLLDQDVTRMTYKDGESSLVEFAGHALSEYGITPPAGILPQAVSLLSLPESNSKPEPLLDGLLDHGELMMLFAWRGVGKSLFALLLAICFASAKTAFGGRIRPSRKYRTLLIDAEMSAESLKRRAGGLCRSIGLPEHAAGDVMVRSARSERKELNLETAAGWKDLEPDVMQAEIIIVDSLFKLFPSAMTSESSGTVELQKFLDWCRNHSKTLVIIDHEGKRGGASYGTIMKEISLDVVMQLIKVHGVTHAKVTKVREHASHIHSWIQYRITAADSGNSICFEVRESTNHSDETAGSLPSAEVEASSSTSKKKPGAALDEAILTYIKEHPEHSQGEATNALKTITEKGRSTIQARIKELLATGKLPFWRNPPKTSREHTSVLGEGE